MEIIALFSALLIFLVLVQPFWIVTVILLRLAILVLAITAFPVLLVVLVIYVLARLII